MTRKWPPSRFARRAVIALALLAVPCLLISRACRQWSLNRALIAAIHKNDDEQVRFLLAQKADPNAQELLYYELFSDKMHGKKVQITSAPPALVVALYQSPDSSQKAANLAVIKALLEAGADANIPYIDGNTPLMTAVWQDNPELVRILLERGADIHAKNSYGADALMKASGVGDVNLISLLLDKGADINAKDDYGCNALRFAILYGKTKSVKKLIDQKIDVNARDNAGVAALTVARQMGPPLIFSFLQKAGAKE